MLLILISVLLKREEEFSGYLNNRATFQGFTALHYAVLIDSKACVEILLNRGANPTIESEAGHQPIDYAKEGEIKEMLKEYSIKHNELLKEKVYTIIIILRTMFSLYTTHM